MMLELQQPRPMPHAISLHSVDPYLPWANSHHHLSDSNKLPPLRVNSDNPSPSPPENIIYRTATSTLYTPPEMNAPLPTAHPMGGYEASTVHDGRYTTCSQTTQGQGRILSSAVPSAYSMPVAYDSRTTSSITIPASSDTRAPAHTSSSSTSSRPKSDGSTSPVEFSVSRDLRIPTTVRCPQMSLAQLAAEVTCLFWFENGNVLKQIEAMPIPPSTPVNYIPDAKPTAGFKKWVSTLLSTTQVKPNVVLLALFFIYRLKGANPAVKGKSGSEYRLLTVALMLGNKFLDDNTYTNKTWADVSGITAQEVHIMEVEFLSNMRYSLFVSEPEWKSWHVSLGKFGTYINQCIHFWEASPRPARLQPTTGMSVPPALPSPPASSTASPQVQAVYSPNHVSRITTPLVHSQAASSVPSPIRPVYEPDLRVGTTRKRSHDDGQPAPAAKRQASAANYQLPQLGYSASFPAPSVQAPQAFQRPQSNLAMPPVSTAPVHSSVPQAVPYLPAPGPRAMSMVYPQHPVAATSQPITIPPIQTNMLPQPAALRLDPARILSPYGVDSANSSPISATYGAVGTPHTRLSPSYYLAQRSSPYKPVRRPHTLLAPPPSLALHNPARQVSMDQMQYHSLGRPMNERQHGHIPYQGLQQQHWSPLPSIQLGGAHSRAV